jgi:Fe-S cluster biogenesis protein NfuA
MSEEQRARLDVISALMNQRIGPSLQAHGGALHVVGLSDSYLSIHYQGACGSCPSSTSGTLAAIQNLVRTIEPDAAVVAV